MRATLLHGSKPGWSSLTVPPKIQKPFSVAIRCLGTDANGVKSDSKNSGGFGESGHLQQGRLVQMKMKTTTETLKTLENKVALVTGSSSGIGRAAAWNLPGAVQKSSRVRAVARRLIAWYPNQKRGFRSYRDRCRRERRKRCDRPRVSNRSRLW